TRNRTRSSTTWCAANRRANSSTRVASGPSAARRGAGLASTSSDGAGTAAPIPPKRRPRSPRRSSTPKCSRAGASTNSAGSPVIAPRTAQRVDANFAPRAGGLEHDSWHHGRRPSRELDVGDRAPREQHDVVGEVHHGGARRLEVPERRGLEERLDDDLVLAPFDAHGSEVH